MIYCIKSELAARHFHIGVRQRETVREGNNLMPPRGDLEKQTARRGAMGTGMKQQAKKK